MNVLTKKVLIWVGCMLAVCVIIFLRAPGLIGWVLLFSVASFLAKALCLKVDRKQLDEEAKTAGKTITEYVKGKVPTSVIALCETYKGKKELKSHLRNCVASDTIRKIDAAVLLEEYSKK